jgi:hypothetical protein
MKLLKKPLAGPGYIILNGLRILNIIGLTAVMVASWIMLVRTFVVSKVGEEGPGAYQARLTSQFFFFDAVSHIITSCISSKYQSSLLVSL